MEKRNPNTNLVAALLVVAAVVSYGLIGKAGLEPDAPPGDTMKTLQEIYDAVGAEGSGVSQREAYCEHFLVPGSSAQSVFTVDSGKRFVLLKLWALRTDYQWSLRLDGDYLIHGSINGTGSGESTTMWDFPDRCVVAEAGQELTINNHDPGDMHCTIIGYFYDVP